METSRTAVAIAAALVAACTETGSPGSSSVASPAAPPEHLRDTGIDADGVLPFAPQYPLWTDGATKRRWIWLPPGTSIDASAPDTWVFPAGTKLWKEFAFDGRAVETRLAERLDDGAWRYAAYVWTADGEDAIVAPRGASLDVGRGRRHDVPAAGDCLLCHDTSPDRTPVLGFSAVELGAARLAARTSTEAAALGYLYANCGHCHDATGELAELAMNLRSDALATTVGIRDRIVPGRPEDSLLFQRMSSREPARQMPPLGTRVVDDEALALVGRWITELEP
jgi:mono/diheme cytochrome c family protein